jgi:hypothetical protein
MKAPRHRRFGGQTLGGIVAIASFALLSSACIAQADSGDEGSTEASESRVTTVASNINAGLAVEGSSSATTDPSKSGKGDGPVLTSANNHLPVPSPWQPPQNPAPSPPNTDPGSDPGGDVGMPVPAPWTTAPSGQAETTAASEQAAPSPAAKTHTE